LGVGCFHCQQISVPGSIAPPKLRTAKCVWVDSTSKTQGFGVGDRSRKMFLSRSSCAWSRFAHPWCHIIIKIKKPKSAVLPLGQRIIEEEINPGGGKGRKNATTECNYEQKLVWKGCKESCRLKVGKTREQRPNSWS
jgi:hypothetical protein